MSARSDVVRMLAELAKLTTLEEGSPQAFRVRAYENAIHAIEGFTGDIEALTKADLVALKGVGGSTADKILELLATGRVAKLESLREKYPPAFVELTRIPGLGPKTLATIRAELGVEDLAGLKAAIDNERLRELPGLGKTTEQKIGKAIERLGLHGKDRRTPLHEALPLALSLAERIGEIPGVVHAEPCGSIRRFRESVGDIDIVVATEDSEAVADFVGGLPEVAQLIGSGRTKTSFLTREGMQVDVRTVGPGQLGSALLYFTGSKAHNIALRQLAIDRGWLLSEYGLFEGDRVVASETEEEIYEALGLPLIPATLREDTGEIAAGVGGRLPAVIGREDIRGDLHFHSDRSGDGRASLEEMVEAGIAAGYEYVAFTDHGEDLAINGSTRDEMLAHRDRIRELDRTYPEIRLLYGCELNIGPEGDLDYDRDFRLEFDFCVASIHSHFDLPADQQTVRLLTALQDPAVNVLGHLSGRMVGRRPGIEFDVEAVLAGLEITGVALEVNGALDRLDATSDVVRLAMARDIDFVIDTDAHHPVDLVRMPYGVRYAQRGWVTPDRVVNAWEIERVEAWASARRG